MTKRKKATVTEIPTSEAIANPDFVRIIAQRDWRESIMPKVKHTEARRNEVFLMNVKPKDFRWFDSLTPIGDFKKFRLGHMAFTAAGKLLEASTYVPMFGALKKGARIRRKERKPKRKAKK
jgi:hypothetical protein